MNPRAVQLRERTKAFASAVIKYCEKLPNVVAARRITEQLIDSAGSAYSNYRATCRARSPDEFIAKIGLAAEESDESQGWLELLVETNLATHEASCDLIKEADELTAIFVASRITAQRRKEEKERQRKEEQAAKRLGRRK